MTPTIPSLGELTQRVRTTFPDAKAIQHLHENLTAGFIDFTWRGHHFAIKPTLEAFEVKDQKLFVTAGSLLVQTALVTHGRNETVIAAMTENLDQAIDVIRTDQNQAMALVASVKKTLGTMIRK